MPVRWEDVDLRMFIDNDDVGTIHATDFSADTQLNTESNHYQGDPDPTIDATYNGERISFTLELKEGGGDIYDMMDRHEQGIRKRDGTGRITILVSHVEPDGSVVAYRYSECIVTRGERGRNESRHQITLSAVCRNKERVQ